MSFIEKYKPQHIKDFCMDPKLLLFLNTILTIDDANLLFIGEQNTGKTAMLNAMLRDYYELTDDSFSEKNILCVNNLKEQGINYFRNEMKIFCQSRSTIRGKKKTIIIDDIDMINDQCQQVFRNYIDKYKHNVNFIAVCSNVQKVIESIQSRLHIVNIYPPTTPQINEIVDHIIRTECIVIDEPAKAYLLSISNNSIRTLINHLEKIHILGEIVDVELCKKVCSIISFHHFEVYFQQLKNKELYNAIQTLNNIFLYGYSVIDILDYIFTFTKMTGVFSEDEKYKIIPFLCKYIYYFHNIHEDSIELALFTKELYKIL